MISERLRRTAAEMRSFSGPPEMAPGPDADDITGTADVIDALVAALDTFVSEYVELVNSGDAGFWEPEDEPKVKAARRALAMARRK